MLTISDGLAPLESVYPTYEYLNLTKENERLENQKFTRISLRTSIDEQIQKIYIKISNFKILLLDKFWKEQHVSIIFP